MSTEAAKPLSPEERLKAGSRFLRGGIAAGLEDRASGALAEGDAKLLKFHGSYQQDDRDLRLERMEQKLEPAYQFMVRVRMPGGVCLPWQWLALDRLAREHANGTLRVTTRQTFQLHGVLKRDLKRTIAGINAALLSTVAACGDVNRNVVCHNNPYLSPLHRETYAAAQALSARFLPRTRAYHEIWLDGEPLTAPIKDEEPLYGATYLPRKLKMGVALPPWNDIDVFAQDLGFIAVVENGRIAGYDVAVGGGMGMSHNEPATYARLADVVGFCPPEQLLELAEAVVTIQRDYGDRSDRKHARLKYTLDDCGLAWFRGELERRLGRALAPARPFAFEHNRDPEGWAQDREGNWHLTLNVLSGRIRGPWLDALREIALAHEGDFRLTANQNVTIAGIAPARRAGIEAILARHGIDAGRPSAPVRRDALSCVALPTCGLAMAESERMLPGFLARLQALLERLGLGALPLAIRVTGCPNGCARPYLAEIALVGKSPGRYDLFLGGDAAGTRLNRIYRTSLTERDVIEALAPILEDYARERLREERFGDFVLRRGYVARQGNALERA